MWNVWVLFAQGVLPTSLTWMLFTPGCKHQMKKTQLWKVSFLVAPAWTWMSDGLALTPFMCWYSFLCNFLCYHSGIVCIHSMAASERSSQMSSTWVTLLLLQRQSLLLCGHLSCVFSCLQPEIQMVLLAASQRHLGKLSETGSIFSFSMSLSSTKSICNSVFPILTATPPFFLNVWVLWVLSLLITSELDLVDHRS